MRVFDFDLGGFEFLAKVEEFTVTAKQYIIFILSLILGILLICSICRLIFGKKAQLNMAITSAIEILFMYIITIVICGLGLQLQSILSPLPFVTISEDYLVFFPILNSDLHTICGQLLNMVIIAFLVNLLNSLIPRGKKFFVWLLLRILSLILCFAVVYGMDLLLEMFIPDGVARYAPLILIGLLLSLILLGSLKVIVGIVLAFMNPILGALYTFFFANFIGRALAKALITTLLLTLLLILANVLNIVAIQLTGGALLLCIPLALVVFLLWILVGRVFIRE